MGWPSTSLIAAAPWLETWATRTDGSHRDRATSAASALVIGSPAGSGFGAAEAQETELAHRYLQRFCTLGSRCPDDVVGTIFIFFILKLFQELILSIHAQVH